MTIPWKVVRLQIAGFTGLGRGLAPRAALGCPLQAVLTQVCSTRAADTPRTSALSQKVSSRVTTSRA